MCFSKLLAIALVKKFSEEIDKDIRVHNIWCKTWFLILYFIKDCFWFNDTKEWSFSHQMKYDFESETLTLSCHDNN